MDSYSTMLDMYGVEYIPAGYYWQIGEIKNVRCWILHLSVIIVQLPALLNLTIPALLAEKVAFKIVRDPDTAKSILDGSLGYVHLGKIVCIYPKDDKEAISLAQLLLSLTQSIRGPAIPTDRHLGSIVYTRYDLFNPIIQNGPDNQTTIPFTLPQGVDWPFHAITAPSMPKRQRLLHHRYYPLGILKPDVKGDVLKAIYFKHPWQIQFCLIKQGRKDMFADAYGRDIQDRLQWQFDLFHDLASDMPLPKIFDYFQENGDSYLTMEFIKGISLAAWIHQVYNERCWYDLSFSHRSQLLHRLKDILSIIKRLHQKGLIHRDITPDNFLIDPKGRVFLLDMELSWSSHSGQPAPPFDLGTPGYMSPEQYASQPPTVKEDIYGIGSLMLVFFTHLSPMKFNGQSAHSLQKKLFFFTGEEIVGDLVTSCWDTDPDKRPALADIQERLQSYRPKSQAAVPVTSLEEIRITIQAGLRGLAYPQLLSPRHRWISRIQRKEDRIGNEQLELTLYEGWHTGMAGPLWLVAIATSAGFSIDACRTAYFNSWEYIKEHYFTDLDKALPGLYRGGAGIALALAAGLNSDLLPPTPETLWRLQLCFSQSTLQPDLSSGWAGQGIALLQCARWLQHDQVRHLLGVYIDNLLGSQQKNGSWHTDDNAGVVLFLLAYWQRYPNRRTKQPITKALHWLVKKVHQKRKMDAGLTLTFIKAYEVLKDPLYRKIAEANLQKLPPRPVLMDLTIATGLAGWGEIYLEAFRIFNNKAWQIRAAWIAQVLIHCCKEIEKGAAYWLTDTSSVITADLFTGNSGILHFLIRYLAPDKYRHPLSPDNIPSQ